MRQPNTRPFQPVNHIKAHCTSGVLTSSPDTYVDAAGMSITLTPGVWKLGYRIAVRCTRQANANATTVTAIRDAANNVIKYTQAYVGHESMAGVGDTIVHNIARQTVIVIAEDTTYKMSVKCIVGSGNATAEIQQIDEDANFNEGGNDDNYSIIYAEKIGDV